MSDETFVVRVKWGGESPLTREEAEKIALFASEIIKSKRSQNHEN